MTVDLVASVTLHQLRVLATIAAHRSFSRAGEALYLSQPAISDQIRELEQLTGFKLLDRSPGRKHVELTEPGRVLLCAFEDVSRALQGASAQLEELRGLAGSSIVVGAGSLFCGAMLPRIQESFRRTFPEVMVRVQLDQRQRLLQSLARHDLDLVVLTSPIEAMDLVHEPFAGYDMILVGAPDHRLARIDKAPLHELASERLILPERTTGFRRILDRMATEATTPLHVIWEVSDVSARIQAATNGLGIAALSTLSAEEAIDAGRLAVLQIQGFPVHMEWSMLYPAGQLRPPVQAFKEHLLRFGAELTAIQASNRD